MKSKNEIVANWLLRYPGTPLDAFGEHVLRGAVCRQVLPAFKEHLRKTRRMAIDIETATIFDAGFANRIPTGALLLVSDQPMIPEGIKTELSDRLITTKFVDAHIKVGFEALKLVCRNGRSVKHRRFEDDLDDISPQD